MFIYIFTSDHFILSEASILYIFIYTFLSVLHSHLYNAYVSTNVLKDLIFWRSLIFSFAICYLVYLMKNNINNSLDFYFGLIALVMFLNTSIILILNYLKFKLSLFKDIKYLIIFLSMGLIIFTYASLLDDYFYPIFPVILISIVYGIKNYKSFLKNIF